MGDTKYKVLAGVLFAAGALVLVVKGPVLALAGALGVPAWFTAGRSWRGPGLVLGLGLAMALGAGGLGEMVLRLPHFSLTGQMVAGHPQALVVKSWTSLGRLSNPANQVGRLGLVLGAVGGLALASRRRGRARHDASHVHGLAVAQNAAKGTSRWAGERDIAHLAEFGPPREGPFGGGIVVGRLAGRMVRIQPQKGVPPLPGHVCVVAGTGAGKSFSFVAPNIVAAACAGESIVVTDPKGELACTFAPWLRDRGYEVYVLNLAYPAWGGRWNPVAECRDDEEISAFATAVVSNAGKDNSGYFLAKEIQLLKALISLLRGDFPPGQAHLRTALSLLAWPLEPLDARFEQAYRAGTLSRTGYEDWRGAVSSNYENAQSGLTAKLGVIRAESVAKLLSGIPGDMIDLAAIGRGKAALFCVLPVAAAHLKPVLASFYYFFFCRLYGLAAEHGGRLPNPTRFLLDEFANIGVVPGFPEIISTARSLGMQVQFVLQGLKQLIDVYGGAEAEAILANCPVQLFLGGDDDTTTRHFARRLGSAAVVAHTARKDVTLPHQHLTELTHRSETVTQRVLMEPVELSQMDPLDAVCVMRWCLPLYLRKVGWTELPQAGAIRSSAVPTMAEVVPTREYVLEMPDIPQDPGGGKPPERSRRREADTGVEVANCFHGQNPQFEEPRGRDDD